MRDRRWDSNFASPRWQIKSMTLEEKNDMRKTIFETRADKDAQQMKIGSLSPTIMSVLRRHFFAESVRNPQLVSTPEYVTTRPTSELTGGPDVRNTCNGRGELVDPVSISSETLSLSYIVWYWHGQGLGRGGNRRSIRRFLFYPNDVDGRYSRVAEEGTDTVKTVATEIKSTST